VLRPGRLAGLRATSERPDTTPPDGHRLPDLAVGRLDHGHGRARRLTLGRRDVGWQTPPRGSRRGVAGSGVNGRWDLPVGCPHRAVVSSWPRCAGRCRPSSFPWSARAGPVPPPAARCRAPGTAGRRGCRTAGRGCGTPGRPRSQVCGVHGRGSSGFGQQLHLWPLSKPDPGGMTISPGRRVFRRVTRPHRPYWSPAPTNPPSGLPPPPRSRMARTHATPGQWRHAGQGTAEATVGPVLHRCDTDPTRTEPHATARGRQSESGVRDRSLVPEGVRWNMPRCARARPFTSRQPAR
jgi:hypothetical protein